jgi:hypothetical protein
MKINEITSKETTGALDAGTIKQLYGDKQAEFIIRAFQSPKVKDWGDAVDLGTAQYQAYVDKQSSMQRDKLKRQTQKNTQARQQKDTAPDDDFRQDRIGRTLRHQRYYGAKDAGDAAPAKSTSGDTADFDDMVKKVGQKAKDIAYSTIPGAEELGKATKLGMASFTKGSDLKLPTNKGKSNIRRR